MDQLPEHQRREWLELMSPIEPIHFVGQAAPASLLFVNGRRDRLVPPRDARAFQEAGSEPKTVRWYYAGHRLPDRAMKGAFEWIANALQLDTSAVSIPERLLTALVGGLYLGIVGYLFWQYRKHKRKQKTADLGRARGGE